MTRGWGERRPVGPGRDPRPAARPRDDDDLRQPGLDRAALLRRPAGRLPLRARPAGVVGRRHGRRVRPGDATAGLRQPAQRRRRGPRPRQRLHRHAQRHAAGADGGPADAGHAADGAVPLRRGRRRLPEAVREVERGAGAGRGRARRPSPAPTTWPCSGRPGRCWCRCPRTTGRSRPSRWSCGTWRRSSSAIPTRWPPSPAPSARSERPALVVGPASIATAPAPRWWRWPSGPARRCG